MVSTNPGLTLSLPSSKSTFSQHFKEKCINKVVRIGSIIIFHQSKLWIWPSSSYRLMLYFWWGCRGNLKLSERVKEGLTFRSFCNSFRVLQILKRPWSDNHWCPCPQSLAHSPRSPLRISTVLKSCSFWWRRRNPLALPNILRPAFRSDSVEAWVVLFVASSLLFLYLRFTRGCRFGGWTLCTLSVPGRLGWTPTLLAPVPLGWSLPLSGPVPCCLAPRLPRLGTYSRMENQKLVQSSSYGSMIKLNFSLAPLPPRFCAGWRTSELIAL